MIGAIKVRTPMMIFVVVALACGATFAAAKHVSGNPVAFCVSWDQRAR